jgi:predicted xylose isomerase-like sugar epimerase
MGALKQLNYTGPIVVEPFSEALKQIKDNDKIAEIVSASIDSVMPE